MRTMDARPETCSHCGGAVVRIAYGYPNANLMDAAERGEVILGGCIVDDGNPRWQCTQCHGTDRTKPPRRPDIDPADAR